MHKTFSILIVLLTLFAFECSTPQQEQVFDSKTDSSAKYIKETTGATECYLAYNKQNSLGDSMSTIYIEIVNPRKSVHEMPLWRSSSLAALEFMYASGRNFTLEYDAIEVKFTENWDEILVDSTHGKLLGMSTQDVVLADSVYRAVVGLLSDTDGEAFHKARSKFGQEMSDSLLLFMDNNRLAMEGSYGRAHDWSPGGFENTTLTNGKSVLAIYILEPRSNLTIEHIVMFSKDEKLVTGWNSKQYNNGQ